MFDLSPSKLVVLLIVAILVVGPDRLPGMAKDAARMLRTLRELATGAREQIRDELGPEFADVDLRTLNPRTMVQRAVLGEDLDLGALNPSTRLREALRGDQDLRAADPRAAVRSVLSTESEPPQARPQNMMKSGTRPAANPSRPMPGPRVLHDSEAT